MISEPQNVATSRNRLLCYVVRTTVAAILAWLLLYVWDIWADPVPPNLYKAGGLFFVAQAQPRPNDTTSETAAKGAILQSHLASLKSAQLLEKAKERVRMAHPELEMVMPRLRVFTTTRSVTTTGPDMSMIEVSGMSSEPSYMEALINELLSEHIAEKKRERDGPAEGRAYGAAIQRVLECQRDIVTLKDRLKEVEDTQQEPDSTLAALRKQLTEADARHTQAKEALDQFPPDPCSGPWEILQLTKSEPYTHGLDPYSLLVFHPWRALASVTVAWFLAAFLITVRSDVTPATPMPRPTEA